MPMRPWQPFEMRASSTWSGNHTVAMRDTLSQEADEVLYQPEGQVRHQ